MFRKHPIEIGEILPQIIREGGLETPLLQRRLLESWDQVVGKVVARYTLSKEIRNQTMYVKISSPALRQNLSLMRKTLVQKLNDAVGAYVISDIKF